MSATLCISVHGRPREVYIWTLIKPVKLIVPESMLKQARARLETNSQQDVEQETAFCQLEAWVDRVQGKLDRAPLLHPTVHT